MPKYSGACYFYFRDRRRVPLRGFTWSSLTGFSIGRCFCTLELNFYYRDKGVFLCSPGRGLTWSSIARFCDGRCLSTLKLTTPTIETEGVFLCVGTTRERSQIELYYLIWRWKVLKYFGACKFYYRGKRCEVSPGVLSLDLAAEGTFVLWNLQLLL